MAERLDVVVIGAGIVGLATAYRLLQRRPDLRLAVLEKEDRVAAHQSSHNSGVLHAGIYYAPGSLKAKLCTTGKRDLERFCVEHAIPVDHNGKVVVATDEDELGRLAELERRARINGVEGLRAIGPDELRDIEPNVVGIRALHSPRTAVVDFAAVAEALAEEVAGAGGSVRLGHAVVDMHETPSQVRLVTSGGYVEADTVIACAGLQADRVAAMTGATEGEHIVPFRGSWLRLDPAAPVTVNGNIYPVPDPRYPFLGVHATRRIDGEVWIGPNAVLAGAREEYRPGAVDWRDLAATARFGGFWRLAVRNARAGLRELWLDLVDRAYLAEIQRYLPAVEAAHLEEGPLGIRAQAVRPDGSMVEDFSLGETPRIVHVRNAPSPAATASLAIGNVLAERVAQRW